PNEGVIVYRVQTTDPLGHAQNDIAPLALLTKNALTVGQSIPADNGVTVQVGSAVAGGFFLPLTHPNWVGLGAAGGEMFVSRASMIISGAGLVPKFNTPQKYAGYPASSLWVNNQNPKANTIAALGSTVVMELTGEKVL